MVKIRLMRIGAKGRPFYRVVAVDERKKRTGSYLELLGTYNPLTTPKEINLKQDRIDYWVKNGAQMSTGFLRIIGKAPQRVARKPKKDRGNKAEAAPAAPVLENPAAAVEDSAEVSEAETVEVAEEIPTVKSTPEASEEAPTKETKSEEKAETTPEEPS